MGIEPYLVASSLEAVLAQRLVRLLCPQCKAPDTRPETNAFRNRLGLPPETVLYHAVGCPACRQTGYHGRRAIFEWMDIDSEIRQLILQQASTDRIRAAAARAGMTTLGENGTRLVREGVTTMEEVLGATTISDTPASAAKPGGATA
jgi:type II secretory ATPase GspE/PulE/Tfp pilus assembly ATPase PilB-like protein